LPSAHSSIAHTKALGSRFRGNDGKPFAERRQA
jgi:hypothetical protein